MFKRAKIVWVHIYYTNINSGCLGCWFKGKVDCMSHDSCCQVLCLFLHNWWIKTSYWFCRSTFALSFCSLLEWDDLLRFLNQTKIASSWFIMILRWQCRLTHSNPSLLNLLQEWSNIVFVGKNSSTGIVDV